MLSPEHLYHQLAELDGVDHQGLQVLHRTA
jgi:hypothetical protein